MDMIVICELMFLFVFVFMMIWGINWTWHSADKSKKTYGKPIFIIGIVFSVLSFVAIVGTAILNSFFESCRGRF